LSLPSYEMIGLEGFSPLTELMGRGLHPLPATSEAPLTKIQLPDYSPPFYPLEVPTLPCHFPTTRALGVRQ